MSEVSSPISNVRMQPGSPLNSNPWLDKEVQVTVGATAKLMRTEGVHPLWHTALAYQLEGSLSETVGGSAVSVLPT